ncbi:MAG: tetratricopeptide repeat protein [Gemmatimonadota bacterium]
MVQVLLLYLGAAWGLAQVAEFVVDNYGLPRKFLDVTLLLLILGIPAAVVIAWFHGERGNQKTQRFEIAILTTLVVLSAIGTYRISTAAPPLERVRQAEMIDLGDESVAVLAFDNRIPDPELAWLGDGVAELLSTDLAQIPGLRVVSRQHLFDLLRREGQEDALVIPERLATTITAKAGARFMVDGQILGSSDNFIVNASLVDIETGQIAAAANVRGADVFVLVDSISARLAAQILGAPVEPTELGSIASVTTGSLEAFREYQLGLEAGRRFHFEAAFEHLQRAVELDPNFALAHLTLSGLAMSQGRISLGVTSLQAAQANREGAPERDRLFLDAMLAGIIENDNDKSRRVLLELIEKYPDDKDARNALWRMYPSQSEERRSLLEETIQLDPMYATAYNELAYWHSRQGNFDAADSLISRYVELEPGEPNPLDSKGEILEQANRFEEAREAYRAALEIRPDFTFSLDHLARTYVKEGRFADGRRELEPWTRHELPDVRARTLALSGDAYIFEGLIDEGIRAIEQAAQVAREAERSQVETQILFTLLPTYLAIHDFEAVTSTSARVLQLDPLNPIPSASTLAAFGEQGSLEALDALAGQILAGIRASDGLEQFLPLIEAGLSHQAAFYRGDYQTAVAWGDSVRSRGGLPRLGSHTYVRALLETGGAEDALRRARGIFGEAHDARYRSFYPVFIKQSHYFQGRAHELLGDTTAAISEYEELLENWDLAIARFPAMADAAERLASLKGR